MRCWIPVRYKNVCFCANTEVAHRGQAATSECVISVKLNSLDLQCFHRAGQYDDVWGRGVI